MNCYANQMFYANKIINDVIDGTLTIKSCLPNNVNGDITLFF